MGALGLDRLVFLVVLGFADQIGRLTALAFPGRRRRGLAGESHLKLVSVRAQVTNDETIGEDDAVLRFEGLGADLHATQCAVCHNCLLDVVKKRVHCIGRVKPSRAAHTHPRSDNAHYVRFSVSTCADAPSFPQLQLLP